MTEKDPLPQFGANLRGAREERGLSQEALAQARAWIPLKSGGLRVPGATQAFESSPALPAL
jgi:transcriptional regulator with XRE-family HTH domain